MVLVGRTGKVDYVTEQTSYGAFRTGEGLRLE